MHSLYEGTVYMKESLSEFNSGVVSTFQAFFFFKEKLNVLRKPFTEMLRNKLGQ